MLYIFAFIFMAFGFQNTRAMEISDVRSVRCINNTNQTIGVFDFDGGQFFIAPHNSRSVRVYAPGNLQWMVPSGKDQHIKETLVMKKTSKVVFSESAGQIICDPQLNLFNWLVLRTKLLARGTTSGLTFGLFPCYGDEPLHTADQEFSDNCFTLGATVSGITLALTALSMSMRSR